MAGRIRKEAQVLAETEHGGLWSMKVLDNLAWFGPQR
jgi:hypothetical protein